MANNLIEEKEVFNSARQIAAPEERVAYLEKACGHDPAATRRVLELLRIHDQERSFLESSPVAPGATVDVPISEAPGTVIGPYKLLEQIGEGGFGVVFMAEQTQPVRRKVALKVLKPGMDTRRVVARFEAERQALAIMDHPNIAKVHDGGATASGRPYFVMELVKGVPITEFCDQHQLTPRQRLELFVPVCQAVQHAHHKGIIHRDLKPSNVLVTVHDTTPIVKVIDFGVAKALGQELTDKTLFTGFAQIVGTPLYMSPEQAGQSGLDIDTRSDIYSLGVLLYELLTGTTPFSKERFKEAAYDEIRRIIREEEPPRPSTRLSDSKDSLPSISAQRHTEPAKLTKLVRGELDWIVMRCLEKDRNRRYETANGFAADVQRYLNDEPVQAGPPSAVYRLRKFAKRNKGPLSALTVVLLALVGGFTAMTFGLVEARRRGVDADLARLAERGARKTAEAAREKAVQAEQSTRAALDESEAARNEALAVSKFLLEAFRSPDPRADGSKMKVLDLLVRLAGKLDANFAGSPKIKTDLLIAFGRTYSGLRLPEKAGEMYEKALAIRRTILGPDHPDTLMTMSEVAWAHLAAGRAPEAAKLAELTLALQKAKLGAEHRDTLYTAQILGDAFSRCGQHAEAVRLLEPSVQLCKSKLGLGESRTLETMNNLALAYKNTGRLPEAVSLFEETLGLMEALLGPDHLETLNTTNNLGQAYAAAGQPAMTMLLLEASVNRCQITLGPDHPITVWSMHTLAAAYRALGRPNGGVGLYDQAANQRKAELGSDRPDALSARRQQAAARACSKAVELDPKFALAWYNLGVAHYRAGDWQAALAAPDKSMELRQGGDSHDWFFLAMSHEKLGDREKARHWYNRAVEWMDKNKPQDDELRRFRTEAAELLKIKKGL